MSTAAASRETSPSAATAPASVRMRKGANLESGEGISIGDWLLARVKLKRPRSRDERWRVNKNATRPKSAVTLLSFPDDSSCGHE